MSIVISCENNVIQTKIYNFNNYEIFCVCKIVDTLNILFSSLTQPATYAPLYISLSKRLNFITAHLAIFYPKIQSSVFIVVFQNYLS